MRIDNPESVTEYETPSLGKGELAEIRNRIKIRLLGGIMGLTTGNIKIEASKLLRRIHA